MQVRDAREKACSCPITQSIAGKAVSRNLLYSETPSQRKAPRFSQRLQSFARRVGRGALAASQFWWALQVRWKGSGDNGVHEFL